jgi:hypothetical protein
MGTGAALITNMQPELLVTMGAGDISQFVGPIKAWMERKK